MWWSGRATVAGWMAMVATVLVLHFGIFSILAAIWRSFDTAPLPVMCQPLKAASLQDFWSKHWNTAFTSLVHQTALRPLARRFGVNGSLLGVFLISGLVHDLVISVPARGGFGLPTCYFVLQGLGIILAREARRWGLNKGVLGRLYMAFFTLIPLYWLFHPPFIQTVILPMLRAVGPKVTNL